MIANFVTLPRQHWRRKCQIESAEDETLDKKFVLAKALYDNDAEASDELAFRKGDILTVVEFGPNGLDGWWLCSLRNKIGICPGNRLRLLGHVCCPTGGSGSTSTSPAPPRHVRQASDPLRSLPTHLQTLQISKGSLDGSKERRASNSNKVIIPQKVGDVYLYDVPELSKLSQQQQQSKVDHNNSSSSYSLPIFGQQQHQQQQHPSIQGIPFTAMYDTPRVHPSSVNKTLGLYDVPKNTEESYDVPRSHHSSRRSSMEYPPMHDYDVPRNLFEDSYDVPNSSQQRISTVMLASGVVYGGDSLDATYDVPPPPRFGSENMVHRASCASISSTSSSAASPGQSGPSLTPSLSLSLSSLGGGSSSNRSSLEKPHELYDIPKPAGSSSSDLYDVPASTTVDTVSIEPPSLTTFTAIENVYDVPPQVTRDPALFGSDLEKGNVESKRRFSDASPSPSPAPPPPPPPSSVEGKELPLELDAAMDMSVKLQQEVQSSINRLFTLLESSAKQRDNNVDTISYDLHLCCSRVRTSLQDFLDFASGALVNSSKSVDQAVCSCLNKLLRPLHNANGIVRETCQSIEENLFKASRGGGGVGSSAPDDRDRLVACARTVVEDVRQVACFIQGNSTLIFKRAAKTVASPSTVQHEPQLGSTIPPAALPPKTRERPLPPTPGQKPVKEDENLYENDGGTWVDDYDYVNLESKESFHRKNEEIKASLPKELRKSFDNLLKESLVQVDTSVKGNTVESGRVGGDCGGGETLVKQRTIQLSPNDRYVIGFYGRQLEEHSNYLNNAIQAFLLTIEKNQPPKIFVDHGKFVILGAHKLVFIGDTVHRNVFQPEVRHRIQRGADELCETLKTMVQRVKMAAQQFPSVLAVQEMVDSVVDVSQAACELKSVVMQLGKL